MLLALALALVLAGCGDDGIDCGPAEVADDGIVATTASPAPAVQVTWSDLAASANNDCPPPGGAGSGVISLTIEGVQSDPPGAARFSLCLPRPDEIGTAAVSLADDTLVQLGNTSAALEDGCLVRLDRSGDAAATGTIAFTGFCADGTDPAGFAVALDGTVPVEIVCDADGGTSEAATATLSGTAVVSAGE